MNKVMEVKVIVKELISEGDGGGFGETRGVCALVVHD